MSKKYKYLLAQSVASVRDIQRSPSQALRGITRITKNGRSIGFYFSNEEFEEILEDLDALGSKELKKRVNDIRKDLIDDRKNLVSLDRVAKRYGL